MKWLIPLLLVAGCTRDSIGVLEARLAGQVGRPVTELVSRMGTPGRIERHEAEGGETVLAWRYTWTEAGGREFRPPAMEGRNRVCDIRFTSRGGVVTGYRFEGDACGWGGLPDLLP